MMLSPLIEAKELLRIYKNSDVLIFDATNSKDAKEQYAKEHLQGAFFVDVNVQLADIKSDPAEGGRHPLPKIEDFVKTLSELGISKNNHLVIYDHANGSNAAARFWWMLKAAGHEKVQVLNGGFQEAKSQGFPLSSKIENANKAIPYSAIKWSLPTAEMIEVEREAQNKNFIVVDVRDKVRFDGIQEPIDLIAGHIPGAINIPFTENLKENGLFLNPDELRMKYESQFGNIKSENIIVHCGSGVTACHTLLALAYAEMELPKLYVGSWSEWSRNNMPMASKNILGAK
jgi:thiosulfate/3-mercaptopyruvate sulfurtransferase